MTQFASEQGRRVWQCLDYVLKQVDNDTTSLFGIIRDNEECRQQRDELNRLHVALKTYLDTDSGFRYAGFVGSFIDDAQALILKIVISAAENFFITISQSCKDLNPILRKRPGTARKVSYSQTKKN
jgi:hypothetical protein